MPSLRPNPRVSLRIAQSGIDEADNIEFPEIWIPREKGESRLGEGVP